MIYKAFFKRVFDFIISLIGSVPFSLIFFVLAIWIKLDSKGPVLFKQNRIGKDKKPFNILKFRTMHVDAPKDVPTHMLQNTEAFITRAGRFLRKTSLDEMPQIINILIGHMSIVGPRPALWNQYDLIDQRDRYCANDIRPGLTGWAQINGRDELPIPIKAKYDGEYAKKICFIFDLKIFIKTVQIVLKSDGVKEGEN